MVGGMTPLGRYCTRDDRVGKVMRRSPPYVIPTGAKRSGGILALPCMEPGAVDPSTSLRFARDDRVGRQVRKIPPYVIPTGAKRSGGILALPCMEPGAEDPSIPLRSSRDDTGVVLCLG